MNLRKEIISKLTQANVPPSETSAEANFILQNFFKLKNPYIDEPCEDFDKEKFEEIFSRRKSGEPLQYILQIADFMGEKFFVDKNVLIPRPETEILVLETIKKAKKLFAPRILDIGTGSGCIPISLFKNLKDANIFSCDISKEAIKVAKFNAQNLNAQVNFINSDLFQNIEGKYDIIVSNPPYIPPKEKENLQKEVQKEPELALFASDEEGIEFYEKIIIKGRNFLNNNGWILFELGINQSALVKSLFIKYNYYEIEILKDLDGIDRVILAKVQNG